MPYGSSMCRNSSLFASMSGRFHSFTGISIRMRGWSSYRARTTLSAPLAGAPVWEDPTFAGVGGCQVLGDFEQLEVEVSSPAGKIGGARELGVTSACSFAPVAAASGVGPCNVASIIAHAIMVVALCSEDAILASSVHLISHEQILPPRQCGAWE